MAPSTLRAGGGYFIGDDMKKIDYLIQKARTLIREAFSYLTGDDDGFITALVCDPTQYVTQQVDGSDGYDVFAILNDLAKEDWKEEKTNEQEN